MSALIWVDELPAIEQLGDVFCLTLSSGGTQTSYVLSRNKLTAIMECSRRALREPPAVATLSFPAKHKHRELVSPPLVDPE